LTNLPRRAVLAVSLFAPLPRSVRPGERPFRLGSVRAEERRDARRQALCAAEAADRAEAPVVLVPPAELDDPGVAEVLPLLRKRTSARAWEALRKKRAAASARALDSYLATLGSLLDKADGYGLSVAIVPGGSPSDLPDLDEVGRCLAEFRGAPLLVWPDLLREARASASGAGGAGRLLAELGSLVTGIIVEDGDRALSHLPLGAGEVDLDAWKELRPAPGSPPDPGSTSPSSAGAPADAPTLAENFRFARGTPERSPRAWIVDLGPEASEEDLLATRDAVETFLHPPPPKSALELPGAPVL
jgi:hypothetical protein